MVNMVKYRKKGMAKLLVDIPDELMKRIKHQTIDDDVSIKDLVTGILQENIRGKPGKSKDQTNIEKLVGKRK